MHKMWLLLVVDIDSKQSPMSGGEQSEAATKWPVSLS